VESYPVSEHKNVQISVNIISRVSSEEMCEYLFFLVNCDQMICLSSSPS